jgi:hypothetical protein
MAPRRHWNNLSPSLTVNVGLFSMNQTTPLAIVLWRCGVGMTVTLQRRACLAPPIVTWLVA